MDAWPVDFNDDQQVNVLDVVQLTPPSFNTAPGDPGYGQWNDLNADNVVNILDIVQVTPSTFGQSCR